MIIKAMVKESSIEKGASEAAKYGAVAALVINFFKNE
jgi:hypothetical protein